MRARQIEAFRAVMLGGSMTDAARRLNVSQPGISRLIADLERNTGLKLFDRAKGRLHATEDGAAFYRQVERMFFGLDQLADAARNIRSFGTGELRIASLSALALGFLPRVIRRFSSTAPEISISLQARSSATVRDWALSQQCDIGFAANVGEAAGVGLQPFLNAPGVCVLPPGHHLASRRAIEPEDLRGEPFISLALEDSTRHVIDRIFEEANVRRVMRLETQYAATICAMVAQGLGVSIVNPLVAPDYLHTGMAIRRFEPVVRFHSVALFPSGRRRSGLATAFFELMGVCRDEESAALYRTLDALPG